MRRATSRLRRWNCFSSTARSPPATAVGHIVVDDLHDACDRGRLRTDLSPPACNSCRCAVRMRAEGFTTYSSASSSTTRMRAASGLAGPFCANPQPGQGGAGEIAGHRGALQLLPQARRLRRRRRRAVGRRLPGGLDAEGTRRPVSGASAGRPVELRSKSSNTTLFDSMGSSTLAGSVAVSSAAVPSRARRCVGLSSTRRAAYIQAFATVHDFIA